LPVETTYPGVYIEELPSANHAVTPAPTSVTVFIGYSNPFWEISGVPKRESPPFGSAVEIHSFAEYEAAFGGFFYSPWVPDYLGQAVFQFFLNGGATAYVVALKAEKYVATKKGKETEVAVKPATAALGKAGTLITLNALQPVGAPASSESPQLGLLMTITVSHPTKVPYINAKGVEEQVEGADLVLEYGGTVETYRQLAITEVVRALNQRSRLVSAVPTGELTTFEAEGKLLSAGPLVLKLTTEPEAETSWAQKPEPSAFHAALAVNASLDKVPIFNLMALPGITSSATLAEALAYCERKRAFFIMDPPDNTVADSEAQHLATAPAGSEQIKEYWNGKTPPVSANGAIYFPYLQITNPVTGAAATSPPSGFVAGVFAKEDANRGVWKSPAGLETTILGTAGVVAWGAMTDPQQGALNPLGINCIRTFPGMGTVVFGARTLVSDNPAQEQWKYVGVRRMALFLEQSLYASLRWAIFEPNATPLWRALTQEVEAFMLGLFRQGAFEGNSADEAFTVQCDDKTTTQADIENGVVNLLVGFAPLRPAEFVVVQIQQQAGQAPS